MTMETQHSKIYEMQQKLFYEWFIPTQAFLRKQKQKDFK